MLPEWRLLQDDIHEARHHFAVEEAIARLLDEGKSPPTLRLRRVYPAVFVGVHQNTWAEVDVEYCRTHGIQIVRRMNGGGAVYHEMGSFCYSAFFPREHFPQSDNELYRLFAIPVIRTCEDYGITAYFGGRNDVLVGERKIYGSAQFSCYRAFVQSGTFLVQMNFDAMERALTPPKIKFAGKTAQSIRERVTSLEQETGRSIDVLEVMHRFTSHFSETFGIKLTPGTLTLEEERLARDLFDVKYNTDEWNFGSLLQYQITVAERTEEGVVVVSADIEGEKLQKITISGDFLLSHREPLKELERSLTDRSISEAQSLIHHSSLPSGMQIALINLMSKIKREMREISSTRSQEETHGQEHKN